MAADAIRTELKATGGKRIRAGLRAAIEHLADRHGMSAAEQRDFANEVDAECCKIAAQNDGPCCDVLIEEQEDQIKVKVRGLSEPSMAAQKAARQGTKHSREKGAGQRPNGARALDDGRFAATFVRTFHKKTAHS